MKIYECAFFIPILRDKTISDGLPHRPVIWKWLEQEIFESFSGETEAPGLYTGFYYDPITNERVEDLSKRIIIAVHSNKINLLRAILRKACGWFQQQCIYLSVRGHVEFVGPHI